MKKNRSLSHPLGQLGVKYALRLWLVGKPVVDFIFVVIELFRYLWCGRWADAWFNLGLAGTAGACFILLGPVCRCAGVAGAWFILTLICVLVGYAFPCFC